MQLGRLYERMGRQAEGEQLLKNAIRDKQAEKEEEDRTPRIEKANPFGNGAAIPHKEDVP